MGGDTLDTGRMAIKMEKVNSLDLMGRSQKEYGRKANYSNILNPPIRHSMNIQVD